MTPAARISALIEILTRSTQNSFPLDGTVGDYMRHRKYIGSKDRADVAERIYSLTRAHARLGWWLNHVKAADTPRNRVIAFLSVYEGMDAKRVSSLFDGSKFGQDPLTAEEENMLSALAGHAIDHPDMDEATRVECPHEHYAILKSLYGSDFESALRAMMFPAPLDLRVNLLAHDLAATQDSLLKDGVESDQTPYSPWGLRVRGKAFLSMTKAFTKGHVEIQDEGSQLIAFLCAAQPGMNVLDYCAGAGGKTLALTNMMQIDKRPKGRIVAMDVDAGRLEKARPRFRRAHVHDIIEIRALSDEKSRKWLKRQKQTFDVSLIDAPCSGTGTWRRNPDTRWRQFGPDLAALLNTQREILERVAPTVKPGGRLVYATCSILPQENEEQIDLFLKNHPEFTILPVNDILPAIAGADGRFMRLSSYRHNTDGFFAAVLIRNGTSAEQD